MPDGLCLSSRGKMGSRGQSLGKSWLKNFDATANHAPYTHTNTNITSAHTPTTLPPPPPTQHIAPLLVYSISAASSNNTPRRRCSSTMSSPRDDTNAYENPALEQDAAFRSPEQPPHAGISLVDLVEGVERFGELLVDGESASPEELVQTAELNEVMRRIHACVRGEIGVMGTTTVVDSLRTDGVFTDRIKPYVCEDLDASNLTYNLLGYQAGHTIYTLALHKNIAGWLPTSLTQQDFQHILPALPNGRQAVVSNGYNDRPGARAAIWAMVEELCLTYEGLWLYMIHEQDTDRIDITGVKGIAIHEKAKKIIRVAEQLARDYRQYSGDDEVQEIRAWGPLPRLQDYLRDVTKAAVFALVDGVRERKRQAKNSGPS
ncbi:hypothetical protein LTS16_000511 [Friedmanniomyces endolithicus]|uniref:Uncharacterized protein n=1 Tax=Friedmanniomyces endolithicus TaxID=329885 RepID=A0AAN6FW54_9PEZI|nr:hypothetical protein LTR35_013338 [Friedmanniomyces endolithicus]KAK0323939.1 hypothetical protein LTR82_005059 [Friedmanniomyces endolithicus]KAK0926518.1 hypothetical protein LTR57_003972 [Friedmanniomyces endolithicus]KAK1054866.1 hypothetical protein LTS16_000511 [Friedmanniomyces endolithicus]